MERILRESERERERERKQGSARERKMRTKSSMDTPPGWPSRAEFIESTLARTGMITCLGLGARWIGSRLPIPSEVHGQRTRMTPDGFLNGFLKGIPSIGRGKKRGTGTGTGEETATHVLPMV